MNSQLLLIRMFPLSKYPYFSYIQFTLNNRPFIKNLSHLHFVTVQLKPSIFQKKHFKAKSNFLHSFSLKQFFSTVNKNNRLIQFMQSEQENNIHNDKFIKSELNQIQKPVLLSHEQEYPILFYDQSFYADLQNSNNSKSQSESYKSKSTKRKQKLEQLRANFENSKLRKERNLQRHQKQKQKLEKYLQNLNDEEIKAYLLQRKQQKQLSKQRILKQVDLQIGQSFLIDNAYQNRMNMKENKSLAAQIQLIVKNLKTVDPAPNIHLCGLKNGPVKEQLIKMSFQYWPIKTYQCPLQECVSMKKFASKKIYYLSPDSAKTLQKIDKDTVLIIGGLVDRTIIKNASLNRAEELKIQARSLPIRPFMKQRSCLNLDHIVAIVCKYMQVKNWKEAFEYGAPKRWKKEQGEKGLKQLKQQSQEEQIQKSDNQKQSSDLS